MLLKRVSDFLLQNRIQAMAAVFACAFIPLIGSMSIIAAAFVTLRKGIYDGTLMMFAATLPFFISYFLFPGSNSDVGLSAIQILFFLVVTNALTWVYAVCLRQSASWSALLQWVALTSLVAVGLVHLSMPNIQDWWASHLSSYFTSVLKAMESSGADYGPMNQMASHDIIAGITPFMTGSLVMFLTFNALLQVALARWWQATVFNPGGLRRELYAIRLGYLAAAALVVGLVASYAGNVTAVDMTPIMVVVFILAGLSLLHALIAPRQLGWVWLALLYVMVVMFPYCVLFIAILAFIDVFVNFRARVSV